MKSYTAQKNEHGVRLSRFVESVTINFPASLMHKSFRNKRIKINGKKAEPDYRICENDLIELYINDEFFKNEAKAAIKPKKAVNLNIIYEDENIAVIYKPAHILCHSDNTGDADLASSFVEYLTQKGEYNPVNEISFTPALCNRLDRGTEGLVIAAKNYAALRDMNAIIKNDYLDKFYNCICLGGIKSGKYTAYLKHFEKDNKAVVKDIFEYGYKQIITEIYHLKTKNPFTLYKIKLITGRTHQIRAHLSHLGAPVLGDIKYGNRKINAQYNVKTQALCATRIVFKEIPQENCLSYLSEKSIQLQGSQVLALFESL